MATCIFRYPDKVRDEAVNRVLAGETATAVSHDMLINEKSIRKWVKDRRPSETVHNPQIKPSGSVVLVVGDMHHPFCHPHALHFLKAVRDKYGVTEVVCMGDEIDACAMSKYPKDPDGLNAGQELKEAILALQPFYLEFPNVKVCESNHTVRLWKLAFHAGLPASFLPTVSKALNAPDGWVWASRHIVDGVLYTHGDNGKSGQYAHVHYMKQAKQPVVIGHIHAYAGVNYEGQHWAMNVGCLINVDAYAFKYAKGALLPVSLGCGIVKNGKEAYFIPMHVDENNNWVGYL